MRKLTSLLPAVTLLFLFSSCSTTAKRAKSALDAQNYDEAIDLYHQVLSDDPTNAEAKSGLLAAEQGFLDKKLIQVRMARLAGNWSESLSLLSLVVGNEKTWSIAPAGKVSFTQNEEMDYAVEYAMHVVSDRIREHHPLAGEDFLATYPKLFDDQTNQTIHNYKDGIEQSGKTQCETLKKSRGLKTPHFNLMVSQFCGHYGISETNQKLLSASESAIRESLVSVLQLNFAKESFPESAQTSLGNTLTGALQKTAWYDIHGKGRLVLNATGNFVENHARNAVVLEQEYQAPEQYVEQVYVTKTRIVTTMDTVTTVDPATGIPSVTTVPNTHPETYQEWEPQERTRYVTKSYRYPAWKHEQSLTLTTQLNGSFVDATLQFSLSDTAHADGIEHDENQPSMGLSPSRPKLLDPNQWEKDEFSKLGPQLTARMTQLWSDHYCKDFTGNTSAETGEKVMLCLRQADQSIPVPADQWANAEFGVKATRLQEILGRE